MGAPKASSRITSTPNRAKISTRLLTVLFLNAPPPFSGTQARSRDPRAGP